MIVMKVIAFFFCSGIVAAAFGWAAAFGETKDERESEAVKKPRYYEAELVNERL